MCAADAKAVIAWGACASWGCVQAAKPNPTQAVPIHKVITDKPIIKGAGLPADRRGDDGAWSPTCSRSTASPSSTAWAGRRCSTASASTTSATAARTSTPASSSSTGTTRARAGLLPLQGRLQGPDHLQRLLDPRWNGGVSFPIGRPRLHRLQRRRLLGQGVVLRPPDRHPRLRHRGERRQGRRHGRRRGGCGGGRACRRSARSKRAPPPKDTHRQLKKGRPDQPHGRLRNPGLQTRQLRQARRRRPGHPHRGATCASR